MTPLRNIDPVRAMGLLMMAVLVGMGVLDFFGIGSANPDVLKYLVVAAIGVTGGHEAIRARRREPNENTPAHQPGDPMFRRPPEMEEQVPYEGTERVENEDPEGHKKVRHRRER